MTKKNKLHLCKIDKNFQKKLNQKKTETTVEITGKISNVFI